MSQDKPNDKPQTTRERLTGEILTGFWTDLKPHVERDAVFVVSSDLDLVDVGVAVVDDDTQTVGRWIQEAKIQRPSIENRAAWAQDATKSFRFLIVAPYVLIQDVGH